MTLRLYHGEALAEYGFGAGHPFGPDRLAAFWRECTARGLDQRAQLAAPVAASESELLRFHTHEYIERVKLQSKTGIGFLDSGDTPAFVGVYEAAATVAGTTLDAVAHSVSGQAPRAFIPIAGLHHARRDSAAGFCVFNVHARFHGISLTDKIHIMDNKNSEIGLPDVRSQKNHHTQSHIDRAVQEG